MLGLTLDILRGSGFGASGGGSGPTPPSGYTPPLDAYPAAAAYSVRKLSSSYSGSAIEAYRVSDGATQDIGFDGDGLLNTADIISFASGGEVRVRTWYDQSGNTLDAVQTTPSRMPHIYDGAEVITENGKPAIDIIDFGLHATGLTYSITNASVFAVAKKDDTQVSYLSTLWRLGDGGTRQNEFTIWHNNINGDTINIRREESSTVTNASATGVTEVFSQHIMTGIQTSSQMLAYVNGTNKITQSLSPSSISLTSIDIGAEFINQPGVDYEGRIQEIIIYHSDQEAAGNRTGIEENINDYYQITNLPDYTSGFLADYPDAAAAYSVRKLSNTAIKCMRVRRNAVPFDEKDIGFTAGGDLDEAAIVAFGGSDVLTVSAWYDQSGQSNHATQITPNSQPEIYNGTEVITENGRPAINCNSDTLQFTTISLTGDFAISHVGHYNLGQAIYGGPVGDFAAYGQVSQLRWRYSGGNVDFSFNYNVGLPYNDFLNRGSGSNTLQINGANIGTVSAASTFTLSEVFSGNAGAYRLTGNFQELLVWEKDQTSPIDNRTGIESDINTYFYTYNTSGFVVDYPGSVAAYSVRQLGNRQRYAMRVRRIGGAADYLDVGFVAGDLDTQAIIDFGGSDTLGVEVWYDQSRSGNDATNTDTTTMPIIYDGSSIITDGGKPALGRNSGGLYYNISNVIPGGVTQASFIAVTQGPDAGTTVRTWWGSGGGSLNGLTTGNNLYVYNGGSPRSGSDPAVGRTLGVQLTDGNTGAAEKGWRNGVLNYSADSGPNAPITGFLGSNSLASSPLFMQEMILYPSDIDAGGTRTNIELNINTYFNIYT